MTEFDLNHDGYVDAVAYNSGGTNAVAFDVDENGVYEAIAMDANHDGAIDLLYVDGNQDGIYETAYVDETGQGQFTTVFSDTNGDGQYDSVVRDLDHSGVDDAVEASIHPEIIGPATNPDPVTGTLMTTLTEASGATMGTPDSDHDGWNDNLDHYPNNPAYR